MIRVRRERSLSTNLGNLLKEAAPELWTRARRLKYLERRAAEEKERQIRESYKEDARDRRKAALRKAKKG